MYNSAFLYPPMGRLETTIKAYQVDLFIPFPPPMGRLETRIQILTHAEIRHMFPPPMGRLETKLEVNQSSPKKTVSTPYG